MLNKWLHYGWCFVNSIGSGKKVNTDVCFVNYQLEENGITEISEFELKFVIKVNGEYQTTNLIKISSNGVLSQLYSLQETSKDGFWKLKSILLKMVLKMIWAQTMLCIHAMSLLLTET